MLRCGVMLSLNAVRGALNGGAMVWPLRARNTVLTTVDAVSVNALAKRSAKGAAEDASEFVSDAVSDAADRMRNSMGSWGFVGCALLFLGGWMIFNGKRGFDPYPFALMLLIVGGIFQALAMVAIMVGQNVQAAAGDARAETDHETLEAIHTLAAQSVKILEGQNKILAMLQAQARSG